MAGGGVEEGGEGGDVAWSKTGELSGRCRWTLKVSRLGGLGRWRGIVSAPTVTAGDGIGPRRIFPFDAAGVGGVSGWWEAKTENAMERRARTCRVEVVRRKFPVD